MAQKRADTEAALMTRLDVIINLLLESAPDAAATTTKKIERLLAFGLSSPEVAQVIGKPLNYVTAVTAMKKKRATKGKAKK